MDIVEAAGAPCADAQITNKVFSIVLKADLFHDGTRGRRRKTTQTWSTFKQHFFVEIKECRKCNKITSKTTGYQVANTANQALLEAQNDFKYFTSQIIEEFKTSNKETVPPEMMQQEVYTSIYSNELKEMKEQIKLLIEQKNELVQKLNISALNILEDMENLQFNWIKNV